MGVGTAEPTGGGGESSSEEAKRCVFVRVVKLGVLESGSVVEANLRSRAKKNFPKKNF